MQAEGSNPRRPAYLDVLNTQGAEVNEEVIHLSSLYIFVSEATFYIFAWLCLHPSFYPLPV